MICYRERILNEVPRMLFSRLAIYIKQHLFCHGGKVGGATYSLVYFDENGRHIISSDACLRILGQYLV